MPELSESVERGFILSIADAAADLRSAQVAVSVAENDLEHAVLGLLAELEGEDAAEWLRLRADTSGALREIGELAIAAADHRDGMAVRGAVLVLAGSAKERAQEGDQDPAMVADGDAVNEEAPKPKRRRGKK